MTITLWHPKKRSTPFLFCQSSTFVISESYHLFSFDNNKQIFRLYSSAFQWRNVNKYINHRKWPYNCILKMLSIEFRHICIYIYQRTDLPRVFINPNNARNDKSHDLIKSYPLFCILLNVHLWEMHGRISLFYLM